MMKKRFQLMMSNKKTALHQAIEVTIKTQVNNPY